MFTMMNKMYQKQIQTNQTEIECTKSKMEIHCVKSQVQDHPNNVPTNKDFKKSADFSMSSKVRVFCSLQISHIKQAGTIFRPKKSVTPNNSPMQKEEKQPSLASLTANQTSKTLHSIRRVRTCNEVKDDLLFLHRNCISNPN